MYIVLNRANYCNFWSHVPSGYDCSDFDDAPIEIEKESTNTRSKRYSPPKAKISKKQLTEGEVSDKLTEQDVIQKILANYNWRVRPKGLNSSNTDTGGPVMVTVNIMLRTISKIDDVNMVRLRYNLNFGTFS